MSRLTLKQTQPSARRHDSRMKSAATSSSSHAYPETINRISSLSFAAQVAVPDRARLSSSNACGTVAKSSLKSLSNPVLRSLDCSAVKANDHAVAITLSPAKKEFMMHIMIDTDHVTRLRHLVIGTCGEWVAFMRIQPIAHGTRMKVWLCLSKPAVDLLMDAIMRTLPSAEFGHIAHA